MGDDRGRHDEKPAHRVRVSAFALARFPVTNEEYARYLEATGAEEPRFWRVEKFAEPRQPVVGVSWFDAVAYCRWLSSSRADLRAVPLTDTGVVPHGRTYRLPTEAEREWAARGGLHGKRYPWGDAEPELVGAWARGAAGQDRPLPVSDANPNGFGLCHIADNVHEWCSDWYSRNYYEVSPVDTPKGPERGERRASRGGAWRHELKFSRNAARSSLAPHLRYNDYGFRVAAET